MSHMIGGLWKLTLAKVLDVWGRPQGYSISVMLLGTGLAMMAACRTMEMYATAQIIYYLGDYGLGYTVGVFIADTSTLRNRGLMMAFSNSPYIITCWITGLAADGILTRLNFRLGYGVFVLTLPIVTVPLLLIMISDYRKAKKMGLVDKVEEFPTAIAKLRYYFTEFDIVGLSLLTMGLALIMLPFNLQWYEAF